MRSISAGGLDSLIWLCVLHNGSVCSDPNQESPVVWNYMDFISALLCHLGPITWATDEHDGHSYRQWKKRTRPYTAVATGGHSWEQLREGQACCLLFGQDSYRVESQSCRERDDARHITLSGHFHRDSDSLISVKNEHNPKNLNFQSICVTIFTIRGWTDAISSWIIGT